MARAEEAEVEEPVRAIREVVSRVESDEEDGDEEEEVKLAPLPARLDVRSDEEMEVDEAEEREVEEMVVEKGRGAFASAMEVRRDVVVEEAVVVQVAVKKTVVKASPTKMVMPGMFGAAHSEEEEDNSIEVIESSQLVRPFSFFRGSGMGLTLSCSPRRVPKLWARRRRRAASLRPSNRSRSRRPLACSRSSASPLGTARRRNPRLSRAFSSPPQQRRRFVRPSPRRSSR